MNGVLHKTASLSFTRLPFLFIATIVSHLQSTQINNDAVLNDYGANTDA